MSKTLDTNARQFTHWDHVSPDKCASVSCRVALQQLAKPYTHRTELLSNFRHLHIFCRIACLFVVCIFFTLYKHRCAYSQYMIEFSFCGRHPIGRITFAEPQTRSLIVSLFSVRLWITWSLQRQSAKGIIMRACDGMPWWFPQRQ